MMHTVKNISFFVDKNGLVLTPFYDLVNIEAIIREVQNSSVDGTRAQESIIRQHYAMSIGEYNTGNTGNTGNAGNFNSSISAYMLADFADEFEISLPRMQLLMSQMVKSVFGAIAIAKRKALEQGLSAEEVNHIDLCIEIVNEAAEEINKAIEELPAIKSCLSRDIELTHFSLWVFLCSIEYIQIVKTYIACYNCDASFC